MAKYTYNNEPISEDFVTEAAEVGGLNIEEYITSKDGLEVIDESIAKNSPTSLDADVEVTEASETNGDLDLGNGSLELLDPDPKKKKKKKNQTPDNSVETIKRRKRERITLDKIRTSVNEEGDFINDIKLDEVVVTGHNKQKIKTELVDALGWEGLVGTENTVTGRYRTLTRAAEVMRNTEGDYTMAELSEFDKRIKDQIEKQEFTSGKGGDGIARTLNVFENAVNKVFTGNSDFDVNENTIQGSFFGKDLGNNNQIKGYENLLTSDTFKDENGPTGVYIDYSEGGEIETDNNLLGISMSSLQNKLFKQATDKELEEALSRTFKTIKPLDYEDENTTIKKLNNEVIDLGKRFISDADKNLINLEKKYDNLPEGSPEALAVAEEINELNNSEDFGVEKLFDWKTGKFYSFKNAPKDVLSTYSKARKAADSTPVDVLKDKVTRSYYKVVALAKGRLKAGVTLEDIQKSTPAYQNLIGVVGDIFGSDTGSISDIKFLDEIANTNIIPKEISQLPGNHPFAASFNSALEEYQVLNRAYQVNRNPLTTEKENFVESLTGSLVNMVGGKSASALPITIQDQVKTFVKILPELGLEPLDPEQINERLKENLFQLTGTGTPDLALFIAQITAFKGASFNSIAKGANFFVKVAQAGKLAKKSAIYRNVVPIVGKVGDESLTFLGATNLPGFGNPTFEENFETAKFGASLALGTSLSSLVLRNIPTSRFLSPIMSKLTSKQMTKNWVPSVTGAAVGALSYEFASLLSDSEEFLSMNAGDRLTHYMSEYYKLRLMGAKSLFYKNGMVKAFENDMAEMVGFTTKELSLAGKTIGYKDMNSVKKPDFFTIEYINDAKKVKLDEVENNKKKELITEEEAIEKIAIIEDSASRLSSQAELNIAKEVIKEQEGQKDSIKDSDIYVAVTNLQNGKELSARDNYVLANTPTPLLKERMALTLPNNDEDATDDYIEMVYKKATLIESILDGNFDLKSQKGTKAREEANSFLNKYYAIGEKVVNLEKQKNKSKAQEEELIELSKEKKRYEDGGDLFKEIKSKVMGQRITLYNTNITKSKEFIAAGKEGTLVELPTPKDFQLKYDEVVGDGLIVENEQGFYNPKTKTMFVNKGRALKTGEVATAFHEVDHFALRNKLKDKDGYVTEEGVGIIDDVLSRLTPKQKSIVDKRINSVYKFNEDGTEKNKDEYYEEYLTVLSESIRNKEIQFSEDFGFGLTKLIPLLSRKVEMNAETGENLFNMLKDFAEGGEKGKVAMQKISQEAEGKEGTGKVVKSRTEDVERLRDGIKEGLYTNESLIDVINSKSSKDNKDKFAAIDAIIEENWPVISKALGFNPTGQISMDNIKEAVREQMQGMFPNKGGTFKPEFFKDYIPPGKTGTNKAGDIVEGTKVTTFLNRFRDRTPEILERAKALQAGESKLEGESLDSQDAMDVVAPKPVSLKPVVESTLDVFSIVKEIKEKNEVDKDGNFIIGKDIQEFAKEKNISIDELKKDKTALNKLRVELFETNYTTAVRALAKEKGIDIAKENLTPKEIKQITPYEVLANEIGIPVNKITNPRDNLSKPESLLGQGFVLKNKNKIKVIVLSQANREVTTETKESGLQVKRGGESLGLGTKLVETFFNPKKRVGNNYVRTPKLFDNKVLDQAIGTVDGKVDPNYKPKSTESQIIKALLKAVAEQMTTRSAVNVIDAKEGKGEITADAAAISKGNIQRGKNPIVFSKTSGQKELDNISGVLKGTKPENNRERKRILVDELSKYFPIKQILRPTNFTSGTAMSSIEKRGFNMLSNVNKIIDPKLRKEAEKKLTNEELLDLNVIIKEAIAKGNEKSFSEDEINAFKEVVRGKKGGNYKNNAKQQELHDKGVKQIINSLVDMIQNGGPSALVVAREMLYHPSLNANFNRNMATAVGRELGVEDGKGNSTDEHVFQAIENAKALLKIATLKNKTIRDNSKKYYADWLEENYIQFTLKNKSDIIKGNLTDADGNVWTNSGGTSHPLLIERLNKAIESGKKEDWNKVPSSLLRYFSEFAHLNPNNLFVTKQVNGKTVNETISKKFNVEVPKSLQQNLNVVAEQAKLVKEQMLSDAGGENKITSEQAQARINEYVKLATSVTKAEVVNNKSVPVGVSFSKSRSNTRVLEEMKNLDKAYKNARNPNAPKKGISVWDFDDTLATTKSNVLYELPDGTKGKLSATDFAKKSGELENKGATFDFSEFNKITDGKKGPMFEKAVNRNKKFGNNNVFILTARPMQAAGPIRDFLKALGLDIPLKNIVGLEDGAPSAKARWVVEKASEGYNDFYFADDAYKNVKAVNDALSVLDVKSKSRQAFVKFSKAEDLNRDFNLIIQNKTGIAAEKEYGRAKGEVAGIGKGSFKFFVPSSAEDFVGLLYSTLGKGEIGNNQMAWYKKHLIDPYARGTADISSARVAIMNDYRALKKSLKTSPKDLLKKVPGEPFTKEQAVRVYVWNKQGENIPGLSKTDSKELTKYVEDDARLKVFADELINMGKGEQYAQPKNSWLAGGITSDILQVLDTTTRSKYLEEWQRNSDAIFTEKNMNKLEAAYGKSYRVALENMVERMKNGSNRNFKGDTMTGKAVDWLTGSIGAIMFFNTRSAVLQTTSAANFINFTDNNIFNAGKAFANQPQFWRDYKTLMNSDFLVDRRRGLRLNVNESDIAKAAQKDGVQGVINKGLELGFLPTQIADSFAIASGGASFYRNRINTYKKEGFSTKEAEQKAMIDWRETSEESQQSSRADRISMQQAGPLGRVVLAFANTPMQYTRLMKKAALDLKDGRGDSKTNISKIIYYGAVQNFIFNSLQQALFAISLGDDDEQVKDVKKQKKYIDIANSMSDTVLRGTGIGGSIASVLKNAIIKMMKESDKDSPKYAKLADELLRLSPPVSSKFSKLKNAARSYEWDKKEMIEGGWSLDNPAWLAGGNVISATTNIPLDRVIKKVTNVKNSLSQDLEAWERIALIGGWQDWELGIDEEEKSSGGYTKASFKKASFKKASFK